MKLSDYNHQYLIKTTKYFVRRQMCVFFCNYAFEGILELFFFATEDKMTNNISKQADTNQNERICKHTEYE